MASWDEIVRKNAAATVNAAFRVLGNAADAEDIAQEVFVEAFELWQANRDHRWAGLLRRIAICRSVDLLRKKKATEPLDDKIGCSASVEPIEIAIARELEGQLRMALPSLPPREAEVFCLHYFAGMSNQSIAGMLDVQPGVVATALYKARLRLEIELNIVPTKEA